MDKGKVINFAKAKKERELQQLEELMCGVEYIEAPSEYADPDVLMKDFTKTVSKLKRKYRKDPERYMGVTFLAMLDIEEVLDEV
jgi:hypothetical protein